MSWRTLSSRLSEAARTGGVPAIVAALLRGLLWQALRHPADRAFDRALPVSTGNKVPPAELRASGPNAVAAREYAPTSRVIFEAIISDLPGPLDNFVFVDFGSGKGRVLLLAARRPFKRVVGVEFSPNLHEAAVSNIAHAGLQGRVISTLADAATFEIPPEPCVFYFYNPFDAPVLRAVMRNIAASYDRHPRPMYIVYLNPAHPEVLHAWEVLKPLKRRPLARARFGLLSEHDVLVLQAPGGRPEPRSRPRT